MYIISGLKAKGLGVRGDNPKCIVRGKERRNANPRKENPCATIFEKKADIQEV